MSEPLPFVSIQLGALLAAIAVAALLGPALASPSRLACGAKDPDTAAVCTRPKERAGHVDGVHVDGRNFQMRGWVGVRSIPDNVAAVEASR